LQKAIHETATLTAAHVNEVKNTVISAADRHVEEIEKETAAEADHRVHEVTEAAQKQIEKDREVAWGRMQESAHSAASQVRDIQQDAKKVKQQADLDSNKVRAQAHMQVVKVDAEAEALAGKAQAEGAAMLRASNNAEMERVRLHELALLKAEKDAQISTQHALRTYHDHALRELEDTRTQAAHDVAALKVAAAASAEKQKHAEAATFQLWHTSLVHGWAVKKEAEDKVHNARIAAITAVMNEKKACDDKWAPCYDKPEPEQPVEQVTDFWDSSLLQDEAGK